MVEYKSFLDMPAPEGYVPGLGRGATGFTTRSDIGPARAGIPDDPLKTDSANQEETNAGNDEANERFRDPENEVGLFSNSNALDPDDEEADLIYSKVDQRMQERRKKLRNEKENVSEEDSDQPKISEKFSDLKRALGTITEDEWSNIPEVGDLTRRYKRQRKLEQQQQRFYSVPDNIIQNEQGKTKLEKEAMLEGGTTDGTVTDLKAISFTRDKMLGMKLDQLRNTNNSSKENDNGKIDAKGYLTSLAGSNIPSTAEIGDVRRLRPLLKSLVAADPFDPRGWIGLSRLEELANRKQKALSIIEEGCHKNPKSEDVWLENIRLNEATNIENAKKVASRAVKQMPKSIALWIKASELEIDKNSKKTVIRLALESNPKSDTLWKTAVNLEDKPSDARLLLSQAVELVPLSEDLWLALARLESQDNARKVLNRARKALKVSRAIWIAAARLEEQVSESFDKVVRRIDRGVKELSLEGALPGRSQWISDAETCEKENAILTCRAIIQSTIGLGIQEDDKKSTWLDDGKQCESLGFYETARSIYEYALSEYPNSNTFLLQLCKLEKAHGSPESLFAALEKAVTANPQEEVFWLMYSKEERNHHDLDAAQKVLERAFEQNPNSENIWLSAVEIEVDSKSYDKARELLRHARIEADTERVWVKSVSLERQLENTDAALSLVVDGLDKYPSSYKLWLQKGQIYEQFGENQQALGAYRQGISASRNCIPLWLSLSRLEEKMGAVTKARSTLEKALLANEKNELIWLERVQLERRAGNVSQAKGILSQALKEVPSSGLLWSESIWLENPIQRRSKIREAVESCENDSYLLITVARELMRMGKIPKAKTWFHRSIEMDPSNGDAWLWYYKSIFAQQSDDSPEVKTFFEQFKAAEPRYGQEWPKFAKDPKNSGKPITEILKLAAVNLK